MSPKILRLVLLVSALSLPLALYGGQGASGARPGSVVVQLLAINDFHGNLEPPSGSNGQVNGTLAGGAAYLATHLASAASENPNSIIVAAGDLIGASPLVSALFHDEPTIDAMNAMKLAVSSVGNHEFDKGVPELLRLNRRAKFEYLSANVIRTMTHTPLFPATAVRSIGGVKVGFIGETLQGTPDIVSRAATAGLTFLDEAATANAYAGQLKRQGIQTIVLLIHQGGRQRPASGDPDPNGCENFGGAIDPIVRRLTADVQVVISGHSHEFYNCRIGDHLVTSAGSFGRMFTRINLTIDRSTDRITSASAMNEIATREVRGNPSQTRIIDKYSALAERAPNWSVGSVTEDLRRAPNAAGESSLGDVTADAQLAATSAVENGGAVVAFMNSGGIRADIVATRAGDVTYRDVFTVQPFGNTLTVFTMTGDMIKRLLEQQFDNPAPGATKFLQVSNGFTYRYRLNAPASAHVEADSIMILGRRIAAADRVRVAAVDFLADGGDGHGVFTESTEKIVGISDVDALAAYFKNHSPVRPGPQNRIMRTD